MFIIIVQLCDNMNIFQWLLTICRTCDFKFLCIIIRNKYSKLIFNVKSFSWSCDIPFSFKKQKNLRMLYRGIKFRFYRFSGCKEQRMNFAWSHSPLSTSSCSKSICVILKCYIFSFADFYNWQVFLLDIKSFYLKILLNVHSSDFQRIPAALYFPESPRH